MSKTHLLFIMDRSGSMAACASDAVGGFNTFLAEQQKEPKGKRLTLHQFDNHHELTYDKSKLRDCKPLVLNETYVPRGSTALLDAIGKGMNSLRDKEKVIVMIYTDGYENASHEFNADQIKTMIKQADERGWEILFMAGDLDTTYATQTLGMAVNKVASTRNTRHGFAASMSTMAARASTYAADGTKVAASLETENNEREEALSTTKGSEA